MPKVNEKRKGAPSPPKNGRKFNLKCFPEIRSHLQLSIVHLHVLLWLVSSQDGVRSYALHLDKKGRIGGNSKE